MITCAVLYMQGPKCIGHLIRYLGGQFARTPRDLTVQLLMTPGNATAAKLKALEGEDPHLTPNTYILLYTM